MRAAIILNGELSPKVKRHLLNDDFIIATDGGARHLEALGLHPKAVIGDMDSISAELKAKHADVLIRNDDQDFSDAEKALHFAIKMGFDKVLFLGFEGSRLDHLLATVMLLREYKEKDITLLSDGFEASVVRDELSFTAKKGCRVSLIALSEDVSGVSTQGLKFPLRNARLNSSTHGVSNEATGDVNISVKKGVLLVIRWFHE
ncbi:MAG: thiamine diphosphokinase [Nanoarchaeota archaeon]